MTVKIASDESGEGPAEGAPLMHRIHSGRPLLLCQASSSSGG